MKGIILSGGAGTRLYPLTKVASKQLQPVFDKPMVYYPLSTLIDGGIREVCLISTPADLPTYQKLLGDGSRFGISIEYQEQPRPEGIAQAILIGREFIGEDSVTLILGDNIFAGTSRDFRKAINQFETGATIFGYEVEDPRRYGVVELDANGKVISLEEKPALPKSRLAVPGLYIYDGQASDLTARLQPSLRGEFEITGLNNAYLVRGQLRAQILGKGAVWLDAGTSTSLHEAAAYVHTIQTRQGILLGSPEEAGFRARFLSREDFRRVVANMPNCEYKTRLERVVAEA